MRFDDDGYLKAFYELGEYPKIHDNIFKLDRFVKGTNVIDLGCCTGLLARRLVRTHNTVVGIECNKNYLARAVKHDRIKYENLKVDFDTLQALAEIIKGNNIECVYARRVIPEIYETSGFELVSALAETFYKNGVKFLVIEGRKSSRNAVNPLSSVEKEIAALQTYYYVSEKIGNCVLMERR